MKYKDLHFYNATHHPRVKIRMRNWVKAMTLSKRIAPTYMAVYKWDNGLISASYSFDDIPEHLDKQGWEYYDSYTSKYEAEIEF